MRTIAALTFLALHACDAAHDGVGPSRVEAPPASLAAKPAAYVVTDDKLTRFLAYEREMLPAMRLVAEAVEGGPDDDVAAARARETRAAEIDAMSAAASEKAGLSEHDITELTVLTTEYFARAGAAALASRTLVEDDAKARAPATPAKTKARAAQSGPMSASLRAMYEARVAEFASFRRTFAAEHGEETAALLDAHAGAFVALQRQMLDAALAPAEQGARTSAGR